MNKLDSYILKAEQFLLFAYVVLLPTNFSLLISKAKLGNLILILWGAVVLMTWIRGLSKPRFHWTILLFLTFFLLTLIGFHNASVWKDAIKTIEIRSATVVLPLLICISPALKTVSNFYRLINLYVAGTFVWSLFCLVGAFQLFLQTDRTEGFLYHNLSGHVNMHAVYFSVFLILSIIFIAHQYLFVESNFWKTHSLFSIGVVLSIVITIILLSSRIAIVFMILLLISSGSLVFYRTWGIVRTLVGSLFLAILIVFMVFSVPSNRDRFKEVISYGDEYGISKKWGDAQFRYLIWNCALEVIMKGGIWGTGTGNAQKALSDCYLEKDYKTLEYLASEGETFNAHNQYLQFGVEFGWVGMIAMGVSIGLLVVYSISEANLVMVSFLALALSFFFTESVLERYNGVSLFYFFGPLLFYSTRRQPLLETK